MAKAEPSVQKFMTVIPLSIDAGRTMSEAESIMSKNKIRHLPVMQDSRVVGIVSDRDLKMAAGIEGVDPQTLPVIDVCQQNPYIVQPDAPLGQVASTMAEKGYGSAIVQQNGKLVGIFTTIDVCRALADVLNTRFHTH